METAHPKEIKEIKQIEFKLDEDELEKLKSKLSDIEEFDNMKDEYLEDLKELKKDSYENYIVLGRLYFKCYSLLKEIKDYCKEAKGIHAFISEVSVTQEFQDHIEYYNSGNFGNYFTGLRIKNYVSENRKVINTLIDLFFKIFGDE